MTSRVVVKSSTYRDSISLMKISNAVQMLPGVRQAAVVMATELNRRVLAEAGFSDPSIPVAGGDDMIIAVEAGDERALESAMQEADRMLNAKAAPGEPAAPSTLDEALDVLPGANLAVISVPGAFAKREAMHSLERGLNVFLFSSNVSREDELELKARAREKGLLMMGPDCGTSIINHTVLGFGNNVRSGTIGLVSASGTGLQEVTTLIHNSGLGISQAIGTGGGDLSEIIGGITMLRGLQLLEADDATDVIVLISKPPAPGTMEKVLSAAESCKKPVIINFLGAELEGGRKHNLMFARTLDDAAAFACELAGAPPADARASLSQEMVARALSERQRLEGGQMFLRGLFSGGTLCYESQLVLEPLLGAVRSNVPVKPENVVLGDAPSEGNVCIDMGAEEFVEGRAHPMMDYSLRNMRILREARDPRTAVILIDIELGYGSNPNPAGQLVPTIERARAIAGDAGRYLPFVASIIGTDEDFQGISGQEKALTDAGVLVMHSNAQATRLAALIVTGRSA